MGISADGVVVVGTSYGATTSAVIWKSAGPAQPLGVLDPSNTMNAAMAASADGRVITGNGGAMGAWVVTIPEPSAVLLLAAGASALLLRRSPLWRKRAPVPLRRSHGRRPAKSP